MKATWRAIVLLDAAWTILGFLFAPLLVVFPISLTDQNCLSLPKDGLSLRHYRTVLSDPAWLSSIAQSAAVATVSALIATVVGGLCAFACWRLAGASARWMRALILLPLIVPPVVSALGFYRMWARLGLLDSFTGVVIAHVITALPYVFVAVSAALALFDPNLEQAARSLGASRLTALRRVVIPRTLPGILAGALFAFVQSWDEIVILLFITSRNVHLLPRAIWEGLHENIDPAIAAIAALLVIVTALAILASRAGGRADRTLAS